MRLCLLNLLFLLSAAAASADPDPPRGSDRLASEQWPARWIALPDSSGLDYEVLLFRRQFELPHRPGRFVVHVSGDNRYRLWINGTSIVTGPQRDDLTHWRYETIDLAPFLREGRNVLAAQVWNYGAHRPVALLSLRTGFILQGDGEDESIVNTDARWKVSRHAGRAPEPIDRTKIKTYIVVAPGDRLDAAATPWGWEQPGFDDGTWLPAQELSRGTPRGWGLDIIRWLAPRNLPLMEETPQRGLRVRRAEGANVNDAFLSGSGAWEIPAHTEVRVLLDQGHLTTAFPELTFSGGAGSRIELAYAEALFNAEGQKGHRDEIEGKELIGVHDVVRPDGGALRKFEPLDYRTFRYLELRITTAGEALRLEDLCSRFTAYPFVERGRFHSDVPALTEIWNVGWRTARLCAYETYIDCPYYEQLQYLGDTRIQALVSLYVDGDDRLMRQAIELFDRSRGAEGLTKSRYPATQPQIISPFSLFWISMIHDFHRHRDDLAFLRARVPGITSVLDWFARHVDPATGLLGPLPFWSFVDWSPGWPKEPEGLRSGEPPGARAGGSAILSLQYARGLQEAADVLRFLGEEEASDRYLEQAQAVTAAVRRTCWDPERRLFADTPARRSFSQHTNSFAVLTGAINGAEAAELIQRTLTDADLAPATLYFRFYVLRALKAVGGADQYLDHLGPWHDMLARGLTTFAERPDPTRSDCHAWSASPVYEFLATVAGVEPAEAGFSTVRIAPHLGDLTTVEAVVPHPRGLIEVRLRRDGERLEGEVRLPDGVPGEFHWQGQVKRLVPGRQTLAW